MSKRTYFSRHIPEKAMNPEQVQTVIQDIDLFNHIVHRAAASQYVKNNSDRKTVRGESQPDLRKKENRHLITETSFHCQMKEKYHADDHFVNSAVNTAKASVQSVKELNQLNIGECGAQLEDLKKKRKSAKAVLTRLTKIKKTLVKASREISDGKKPSYAFQSVIEQYDPAAGHFCIMKGKQVLHFYDNAYLFELQYVDPKIRRNRNMLLQLDKREERLKKRIAEMKESMPGICFGTKKFFARHADKERYPDHDVWLNVYRKKRSHALEISGRKDAKQGNFRFRYDLINHTLTYTSQSGAAVVFPGVKFPYGQSMVDQAVTAGKSERKPVAWRIIHTGGSFLIQCIVTVEDAGRKNAYYGGGCIAMDTNYDNFSVCELDGSGNLLQHQIIPFDLEGASSGHAEQILSTALDKVFDLCRKTKKPFAMEDLSLKHVADRYGGKRKNFVTSRFAFSRVTDLVDSKSYKYGIAVTKVNPAYTSQMGKLLFMKKYGLTIHEAASVTTGRRVLGITDRLPEVIRRQLSEEDRNQKGLKIWSAAYPITKAMQAKDMYAYAFHPPSACT